MIETNVRKKTNRQKRTIFTLNGSNFAIAIGFSRVMDWEIVTDLGRETADTRNIQ